MRLSSYAVPLACLVVAHAPFLVAHAAFLWLRAHYEFFPLVVVGAAVLATARFRRSGTSEPGRRPVALGLVVLAWLLLAAGAAFFSAWIGAIGTLISLIAVFYGVGGWRLLRAMLPAWGFLWLLIPPPLGYDNDLISFLQRTVSRVNGPALDLLGIRHYMEGTLVVVAGRTLMIGPSCSGILSLLPVLACTLFYVLWNRLSWRRSLLLLLAAAAWDFVGNIARVLTIVVLFTNWGIDASVGWAHEALGIAVFATVLGLLASTDSLLRYLEAKGASWRNRLVSWYRVHGPNRRWNPLAAIYPDESAHPGHDSGDSNPVNPAAASRALPLGSPTLPALSRTWLSSWPVMGVYCVLGIAGAAAFGPPMLDLFRVPRFLGAFDTLQKETLPAASGAFVREAFEPTHTELGAEHSRAWIYRWRGRTVAVAVDYPFRGWHELPECYETDLWRLKDSATHTEARSAGSISFEPNQATFSRPGGEVAFLLFFIFDDHGNTVGRPNFVPRTGNFVSRFKSKLINRRARESLVPTFQVQLFTKSEAPLTPAEEAEALAFFKEVCQTVTQNVLHLTPGKAVPAKAANVSSR